jgi:hypothetical protein
VSLSTKKKILATPMGLIGMAFFVLMCAMAGEAKAMDYALQIAAMKSQQNATDLARGLRAQGIDAYWIEKNIQSQGMFYRVRIGKFRTIDKAYAYAEGLVESGIFETYAIAAYEAPARATLLALEKEEAKNDKLQAFFSPSGDFASLAATVTPTPPLRALPPEATPAIVPVKIEAPSAKAPSPRINSATIDMVASIGTRGWLLLSSDEVISATTKNPTTLGREVARLAAAVGSRRWSLNTDIASILAPTSAAGITTAPAAETSATPGAFKESSSPVNLADLAIRETSQPVAAPETRASASAVAISAPEIGGGASSPTGSTTLYPGSKPLNYLAPPRLQGSIELRDGVMWFRLRNMDAGRSFSGSARITLSSSKDQQDVAPVAVDVAAGQEINVQVNDARVLDGDWLMFIYDQGGVARLVRGASFAPTPAPAPAGENQTQPAPAAAPAGPPSFITGSFDATGEWRLTETGNPQAQQTQPEEPAPQPPPATQPSEIPDPDGNPRAAAIPPAQEEAPPQVTVTPRQIATTAQNMTLEFDIASAKPLSYVVVSLRAGEFQDSRQALMSTPQGRVPFMIPIAQTEGGFSYEIKNGSGTVLASGSGDFRQFKK